MSSLRSCWEGLRSQLKPGTSLLAVSKTFPSDMIRELYSYGQRDFGENKVQELSAKAHELKNSCPEIRWHFIGHLQSNKIKMLFQTPNLVAVHSVDSLQLFKSMREKEEFLHRPLELFIQVKVSGEVEKFGLPPDLDVLAELAGEIKNAGPLKFKLKGLMALGSIRTDDQLGEARRGFQLLRSLRDDLDQTLELSMGMSQDFLVAQELGSHWVRLGTSLFGGRVL